MANRKRNIQILIRVTEEERDIIKKKMRMTHMTNLSAFIRKMLLQGFVVKMDVTPFKELTHELASISRNVNQLARRANETRSIYEQDILDLRDELYKVRRECTAKLINLLDML